MSASHFFVGLGAGIAILAVPVLALTPGLNAPQRLADWINGPDQATSALRANQVKVDDAAAGRPVRGYRPGDPTPIVTMEAPPTLEPKLVPTPRAQAQISVEQAQAVIPSVLGPGPGGSSFRTGVIRSGGTPVPVRRVAGVDSGDDPLIGDGSPVLVSTGAGMQVGGTQWRAIRGLSGIVGWVPGEQIAVDGEAPPTVAVAGVAATPAPLPTPTLNSRSGAQAQARITNTDGVGVVLRNSPNDADRSHTGLMEGTLVSVLERSPAGDWLRVRDDKGHEGWAPARYVAGDSH